MKKNIVLGVATFALLILLAMSGCAHYQKGTGNKPAFHSISFAPVVNNSFAPQVHTLVSDAIFRSFARGGGIAIENEEGADVTLHVTIDEFRKMIGATSSTDTGRARSLVISMQATVTLVDESGKVLYSQPIQVTQDFYADSGLARAESEAIPQLCDMLGEKIYRTVVSAW